MKRILIVLVGLALMAGFGALAVGIVFSGKKSVTKRIGVEQKPDRVFDILTAFNKLPEMGLGIKEVKLPADSLPRKGLAFDLVTQYGPAHAEVTDYEDNRTLACDITLKERRLGNLRIELEPSEGSGTDVAVSLAVDSPPPFGGLYNLAASRAATAALDGGADKIKELLETPK